MGLVTQRGGSASEHVLQAVADQENTDPLELPRLFYAIDPEALDVAIEDLQDGQIEFQYAGYDVTVYSDGTVNVRHRPTVDHHADHVEADG